MNTDEKGGGSVMTVFDQFFAQYLNEKTQQILPWAVSTLCLAYALYVTYLLVKKKDKVNKTIEKDSDKVVHTIDIEDIGNKSVLCRCWRSEKFPYCDGSHNKHNEETGDNVGPVIVKHKDN